MSRFDDDEDGGLDEVLQELEHSRAQREEAARSAALNEAQARAQAAQRAEPALDRQDARTEKVVAALLEKAQTLVPGDRAAVGREPGREASFWHRAVADSPIYEPAYRVFSWSRTIGEEGFSYQRVLVTMSGLIMLDRSWNGRWPHPGDEFPRVQEMMDGNWTRKPLRPGRLPFYYSPPTDPYDYEGPLRVGPTGPDDMGIGSQAIEQTTEWFVRMLARFLHEARCS